MFTAFPLTQKVSEWLSCTRSTQRVNANASRMRVGASLLAQRGCLSESPSEPPEGSSPALGLDAMLFLSGSSLFRAGQQPAPVPHFPNSPSALPVLGARTGSYERTWYHWPRNFSGSLSQPHEPLLKTHVIPRPFPHWRAMLWSSGVRSWGFSNLFYKSLQSEGLGDTRHRETTVGSIKNFLCKKDKDNPGIDTRNKWVKHFFQP